MTESVNKKRGIDWAVIVSSLFWILLIVTFVKLISMGRTQIPLSELKITEASANRGNLILAHQSGDPVWLANTKCIWTPDISNANVIENGGTLVLVGKERKQGRVSKLEPEEMAKLEKNIFMQAGLVGRLVIKDLMSGREIFNQTIRITN